MRAISTVLIICFTATFAPTCDAFSLLGPFKNTANGASDPWQGRPYAGREGGLGYELAGDIGGPMFIDEGYRWNVPVLYYGFDQSFLDYFGEDGVQAVEQAFAILNALPPASQVSADLTEFPLDSKSENASGAVLGLLDLKSHVLALVVEQLGLANPERFVWGLRNRQSSDFSTNYVVMGMNYDPVTYSISSLVNGVRYEYEIFDSLGPTNAPWASAVEWYRLDPLLQPYSSVSGAGGGSDFVLGASPGEVGFFLTGLQFGQYHTSLTRDDIGGLRFLLHPQNRQQEPLLAGVTGAGTNSSNFVNVALRGGVDKITFTRLGLSPEGSSFQPVTDVFLDAYVTNDLVVTQTLKRIVVKPDLLFQAKDLGMVYDRSPWGFWIYPKPMERSDTSGWQNNCVLNNKPGKGGPGIIRPPVVFTFNSTPGRYAWAGADSWDGNWLYGSFDGSDAPPVAFRGNETNTESILLDTRLAHIDGILRFESTFLARRGVTYRIESSTDLTDWKVWYWKDNVEGIFSVTDELDKPHTFYRIVRETWNQDTLDEGPSSPAAN